MNNSKLRIGKTIRKVHFAIELSGDEWESWLGACYYAAWTRDNIDWELSYLWDNNTLDKEKVTCKRCLGMLKYDLRSFDYL